MSFLLGLTGSIGMGKTSTAKLFRQLGCDVWDADAAVHRLYARDGAAVEPMSRVFPEAIIDGAVDRGQLKAIIAKDASAIKEIEKIAHPLVAKDREEFKKTATSDIVVFDIPLIFETGGQSKLDAVACVSVDAETQEKRVLERGTMTRDQFLMIRDKQMPDAEKRKLADYVIETDTPEHALAQVQAIINDIRSKVSHA